MCGIIGVFKPENHLNLAKKGLKTIIHRGKDAQEFFKSKDFSLGHCLHSIVGNVKQPIVEKKDVLVANCEIYNWQEINKKYSLKAKNDAQMLLRLFQIKGVSEKTLAELDGVYAFAFLSGSKLFVARDIMGIKPVWFSHAAGFFFASEKKALEKIGVVNVSELNPRKILEYNFKTDKLQIIERKFFSLKKTTTKKLEIITKDLETLIKNAIKKRISEKKFGLLFSGGLDSTVIALFLKKMGLDFTCYTAVLDDPNLKEPADLTYAKKVSRKIGLKLEIVKIKLSEVEDLLKIIVPLIEDSNVVKAGVALPLFAACKKAKMDGCKVIFSGLGSEEIFAGYQRHKESLNINKECVSGLLKMYERDLYRDDTITMFNSLELRVPLLDKELIKYALTIPGKYKLFEGQEKYVLRVVAKNIGLLEEFYSRKKKAAQYGSNFHKAIQKLTKKNGFEKKSYYLKTFYPTHNLRLGALISSGKDSIYAAHIMIKQNYDVVCFITIESKNPDSYMFHTPTIKLVKLQSKAMDIPLITQTTIGKKEEELKDLKKVIKKAKDEFRLDGIITGALFSNYQRERIEKICDSLSLKIFSPLWHINQETEMKELVREGFEFIMTKIAAEGLDKSWLNKLVDIKMIEKLVSLKEKIGLNVAGEGGEFETLVLDGPGFKKKITVSKAEIIEDTPNSATLIIKKAFLEDK
ncbi:MAG: diphthine--ammonia ligase [Nanoarchaeota archaeon]|nr:diphthine--ammonia ligase [Nanoarchaeota archaeon]MBU1030775.1 diphthine--ammonia ligase [Nanoarchaeota archaeon]MBU1850507.1 diphthine--ammonia ligase [Nanoarchaeota archaeon]